MQGLNCPKSAGPSSTDSILRKRVYQNSYFLGFCFSLDEKTIIKRVATDIYEIGITTDSNVSPTKFFCLFVKLMHIVPQFQTVLYYLKQPHFKYLTALGLFYIRFSFYSSSAKFVADTLREFFNDCRELTTVSESGKRETMSISELSRILLYKRRFMGLSLPTMIPEQPASPISSDNTTVLAGCSEKDYSQLPYMDGLSDPELAKAFEYARTNNTEAYEIFRQNALRKYLGRKLLDLTTEPDHAETKQNSIWQEFLNTLQQ